MIHKEEYDGYLYKCAGIPKFPAEYSFDFEKPPSISDEHERIIEENCSNFIRNFFKKRRFRKNIKIFFY